MNRTTVANYPMCHSGSVVKLTFHDTKVSGITAILPCFPQYLYRESRRECFSPIGFLRACILPTQQQLELPRGVHCLALPVATDRKRISGWAHTPLKAGQQHLYAVTSSFTSTSGWKLASSGMRSRGLGWEKWARKSTDDADTQNGLNRARPGVSTTMFPRARSSPPVFMNASNRWVTVRGLKVSGYRTRTTPAGLNRWSKIRLKSRSRVTMIRFSRAAISSSGSSSAPLIPISRGSKTSWPRSRSKVRMYIGMHSSSRNRNERLLS
jgi:hypothetical protein